MAIENVYAQFAEVDLTGSGDATIVSAVTGGRIRVLGCCLVMGGTTSLTIKSGSTDKSGAMPFVANGQLVLGQNGKPWIETNAGEALVINNSAAVNVDGWLIYDIKAASARR